MIDGVNLKNASVGDRLDLPKRDADVLIAEGWAEHAPKPPAERLVARRATAEETSRRRSRKKKKN